MQKRKADRCFAGPSLTLNSVSGAEIMAVVASEALCPWPCTEGSYSIQIMTVKWGKRKGGGQEAQVSQYLYDINDRLQCLLQWRYFASVQHNQFLPFMYVD